MSVAVVDYGSGNLHSVKKAFERVAREQNYAGAIEVTSDPARVLAAERIVLPGVGAFADCRRGLDAVPGMVAALTEAVQWRGRPFLGICVGMQLMASRGLEHVTTQGLNWIAGDVGVIKPRDASLKIPHMGWNTLKMARPHPVLAHVQGENAHAYFVHSYAFAAAHDRDVSAHTDYGGPFAAVVARDNMIGTQFHPEKSQGLGLQLLQNFVRWRP